MQKAYLVASFNWNLILKPRNAKKKSLKLLGLLKVQTLLSTSSKHHLSAKQWLASLSGGAGHGLANVLDQVWALAGCLHANCDALFEAFEEFEKSTTFQTINIGSEKT